MKITERMDEFTGHKPRDLRNHHRQECIRRDVERDAEERIRAPLVKLTGKLALRDIKLKKAVTGRKRHLIDFRDVPGAHEVAAAFGIVFQAFDDVRDLVDMGTVRRRPAPPLVTVHRAEIAVRIRPFVPDGDFVIVQELDVRVPAEEPQQLDDDRAEVELLRGEAGKSLGKIVAVLPPENGERASARAVATLHAVRENVGKKVQILFHAPNITFCPRRGRTSPLYFLKFPACPVFSS